MKLTAILIDDEYKNSEVLKYELEKLNLGIQITGIYDDAVMGLKAIKQEQPDIIFLDIEMPKLSGFEILDLLGSDLKSEVVFVTAYNQYAVNAFQYYAIDYLLKPVSSDRLAKAVDKVIAQNRSITKEEIKEISSIIEDQKEILSKLVVPISNGFQMIHIKDIIRCEADNNYTTIHIDNGRPLVVSKSLIHFEKLLAKNSFLRIHQSHLVHEEHIVRYVKTDGGHLLMSDQTEIPVARSQKSLLNTYFKSKSV